MSRLERKVIECDAVLGRSRGEVGSELLAAKTLIDKGYWLGELGRSDEEIACYDEVVARFGASQSLELRRQVARALHVKAHVCGELGQADAAASAFAEAVARVEDSSDPELRGRAIEVLYEQAFGLVEAGRATEARGVLAGLLENHGDADLPLSSLEAFVCALTLSAKVDARLGDLDSAVQRCDEVVRRYGGFTEPEIRSAVAWAMVWNATVVGQLGREEEAVELLEAALAHIGEPVTQELRDRAAEALRFRGNWLERRGRRREALADYRAVLDRFAGGESAIVDLQRTRAGERIDLLSSS